ncbi:MAG TPA: hypothetical protein VGI16_04745 [Candidatus Acidoferrum sp.]|jgi:hypothetical protein
MRTPQKRIADLKALAARLDREILDNDVKKSLLDLPKYLLEDAEKSLLEQGQIQAEDPSLAMIANRLNYAQSLLTKYGPNMKLSKGNPKRTRKISRR